MKFAELVDITELQELCESFTSATGAATAILELDGTILSASGWKEICTKFHRVHPITAKRCLESDTIMAGGLKEGLQYNMYQCKNGLYDAAIPISINGIHVANFFAGQFFLKEPDIEYFKKQAEEFGFDVHEYLHALSEVQVYSQDQITAMMDFFSRLARIMGEMGLSQIQLKEINAELKKHQEHLVDLVRERTADLNKAQEIARMGSWKWDIRSNEVIWSDNMYPMFGFEPGIPEHITHESFLQCVHPDDLDLITTTLTSAITQKNSFTYEFRIIPSGGNERNIRVFGEVRCDANGEPVEVFGTDQDITDEKRNEAILIDAKKRAEEANLAKVQFLSRMSHELRTPLNAILGYSQLLQNQLNLTEKQKIQIKTIMQSGEHLLDLINEILEVSRIEQKKITIENKPFNMHNLISEILEVSNVRAQMKDLTIVYEEVTPVPEFLSGDERRVKEILLNLLTNAIKYSNSGVIKLLTGYNYNSGGVFTGEVTDTGIGIEPDKLGTIFLPFTQLSDDGSTTDGAGLGLTIVKQLLDQMGGTIHVSSEFGKGSTFLITIPLPVYIGVVEPSVILPDISGYSGTPRVILIVDDNPINASFLVSVLEPLGFNVFTAENGRNAVSKTQEIHPDMILLDLIMPVMDGLQTIEEIRKYPELDHIKIIGISATVTENTQKDAFIKCCDDFLTKPVKVSLLLEKIHDHLDLTWITKEPEIVKEYNSGKNAINVAPPVDFLTRIHKAVEMGDFSSIEHILVELSALSFEYMDFIQKIRIYSTQFDDEGILNIITEIETREDGKQN